MFNLSSILESEQYIDNCTETFMKILTEHAESGETIDIGTWLQWFCLTLFRSRWLLFESLFAFHASPLIKQVCY
jgi:hypothetical protein